MHTVAVTKFGHRQAGILQQFLQHPSVDCVNLLIRALVSKYPFFLYILRHMVNTSLNLPCIFVTFHCTIEEGAIAEGDDMFHLRKADVTARIPPHVFFFVSAIFHYLGPAFAVLLFSSVSVLAVASFRLPTAPLALPFLPPPS